MWLNEGWTTYSTRQSLEAIYGKERVSGYWNEKHFEVLNSLPHKEGVRAVTPVDSSLTYSSTVYEKGAMVVTTLEAYFPQGVFFDAVKAMLDSFQYKNYNSYQVRDFIATYTQDEGFKDFFNRLVFEDKQINYDVYRSADGGVHTVLYPEEYDGQLAVPVKEVNQKLFTDTDRRLAVLTTSHCTQISTAGEYDMPTVYGKVKLKTDSEPSDWQTVLHWAGPSADSLPQGVEKISSVHYWTVQYDGLTSEDAELKFYFELSDNIYSFDSSLVSGFDGKDSVMLLYRKDCKSPWQRVGMSEIKDFKGYASTDFVACGDYVFANGDKSKVSIDLTDFNADAVKIYPNPSSDKVNIVVSDRNITKVNVYSQEGKLICRQKIHSASQTLCGIPQGSYVFEFVSGKQRISKQVIIK
ncbi:MAG: T9SS type A sorting domain-containing protein, partial [Bacteroidales bacterium]|nr:T9SS type A sorting domain-containing protein [Bacteroidales bacterium]